MPRKVDDPEAVRSVLVAFERDEDPDQATLRLAVLHLLHALAERSPGRSVEVRVPPYGAAQCGLGGVGLGTAGPQHRRGTPPNVIEMTARTWVLLATAGLSWEDAVAGGEVTRSGTRTDLSEVLQKSLLDATP